MVIDKIRKMSARGVKLKSESYFSISPDVLELWRKNLRGADSAPPPPHQVQIGLKTHLNLTKNRAENHPKLDSKLDQNS